MTTKLSDEQRRVLQRMAAGQKLVIGVAWAYHLVDNMTLGSSVPTASSVRGLIVRRLIVWGSDGYELSPAGREAAQ
jgi:hypothetical protein